MEVIDWIVLGAYFVMLLAIGIWAYRRVSSSADFFTAGGRLPWWLSGISHHVSGYSGAVFVAYAGIAYTHGFTLYIWWACGVAVATLLAALFIAPRWATLRMERNIQSPTEYLVWRYNLTVQQTIAWSGVFVKLFDIGGKLAAIAILLNVFTDASLTTGILLAGGVTLFYITIGGLWADVWNDFAQFIIQLAAGITMFVVILLRLGDGVGGMFSLWERLPEANSHVFNSPYTAGFALAMLFINFFSYSGGSWNLAVRFISSSSTQEARKAGILSAGLYLVWPLILLFPMFAAPLFFPDLDDPTLSYGKMATTFLPAGLVGLVLASMFANTLSMTSSDSNTVSSVITRDILPVVFPRLKQYAPNQMLGVARVTTFLFTALTIVVALNADHFGGVFSLIVSWFAALLGPIAVPMILGILPAFRRSGSAAALLSVILGFAVFVITKLMPHIDLALQMGSPMFTSLVTYTLFGFIWPHQKEKVS